MGVRHHLCDKSPSQGLLSIDNIARQCHLGGLRKAHDLREKPCASVSRNNAQLDEALGELRTFACKADIAHAHQIAARADRRPVHSCDHGYFKGVKNQWYTLDPISVVESR